MMLCWIFNIFILFNEILATDLNITNLLINEFDADLTGPFDFNPEDFVSKLGYSLERHNVTTKDGYILEVHRILNGKSAAQANQKPPVLIMHGFLSTSADFLIGGQGKSIALRLVDLEYDVWLGNNRGNTYSRKHNSFDPKNNAAYWDFSFDELGKYDTPAIIDNILEVTNTSQLVYIGHDQGATQFFVMASEEPSYNKKITGMIALAPSVYMSHLSNLLLQILKNFYVIFELLTNKLNIHEFLPHTALVTMILQSICNKNSMTQPICALLLFLIEGFDSPQLDKDLVSGEFVKVFPGGGSIKEFKHFLQGIKSGAFRKFDYGVLNNFDKYHSAVPPAYDLSKVTAPIVIFHGQNDWLVSEKDVTQLVSELKNVTDNHLIKYQLFNHYDFYLAKDVDTLFNFDCLNVVNQFTGAINITTTTTTATTRSTTSRQRKTTATIVTETSSITQSTVTEPSVTTKKPDNSGRQLSGVSGVLIVVGALFSYLITM